MANSQLRGMKNFTRQTTFESLVTNAEAKMPTAKINKPCEILKNIKTVLNTFTLQKSL